MRDSGARRSAGGSSRCADGTSGCAPARTMPA